MLIENRENNSKRMFLRVFLDVYICVHYETHMYGTYFPTLEHMYTRKNMFRTTIFLYIHICTIIYTHLYIYAHYQTQMYNTYVSNLNTYTYMYS
ncbi:hypothetical protein HanIR_Chr13g0633971 [Helianthus annuus]|nr:hypothetical protein HanIR_Chr13g0633971 [Helianthus annuus]